METLKTLSCRGGAKASYILIIQYENDENSNYDDPMGW